MRISHPLTAHVLDHVGRNRFGVDGVPSFYDLIRAQQQRRRDREAERLGGFEVDDQLPAASYAITPGAGTASVRNPGKSIVVEARPRWRIVTSENSARKSVVTAKSRPSNSCSRARPGHRP